MATEDTIRGAGSNSIPMGSSSQLGSNRGTATNNSNSREGICPVVRWRDVGTEGVAKYLAPFIARNRPFLMSGYWTHQVLDKDAAQRWKSFAGIKAVLAGHGLDQLRVDISCTKRGASFRGDKANREQVSLKLIDMVEIAEAHELGKPHWATSEEVGLDFYLCQCPVVSREEGKPEVLSAIAGEFRTPSCVPEGDLLQINLWVGAMETTTNMHYDANHNLLFVLKGTKRVALLPPSMTAGVHAMPVYSESVNHSRLQPADTAAVVIGDEAMEKGAVYADVAEGEALFIPEGWWHQVTSSRGTVAVNVWFKGARPALCEGPSSRHMREYYLRCLVESLLADRLREATAVGDTGTQATASDIEVTMITGNETASSDDTAVARPSPLCSPNSTPEQRNHYLRTIGTERMTQDLPRIARERPADWARLVAGLDPITAHVITTQWESAGGAVSMPEFYAAIFGTGDEATGGEGDQDRPPAATTITMGGGGDGVAFDGGSRDGGIGSVQRGDATAGTTGRGSDFDIGGDVMGTGGGERAAAAAAATAAAAAAAGGAALLAGQLGEATEAEAAAAATAAMSATELGEVIGREAIATAALPQQQQQQQQQQKRQTSQHETSAASDTVVRPEEVISGVALQERLVRLREAFTKEQCGLVLKCATGW